MSESKRLRIMTYNVHSCIGTDGRHAPSRIAEVIAAYDPDVIALQELDVGKARTKRLDQPHEIARELNMHFHFHPAIELEEERYGDAVLSRYPMHLRHAGGLPTYPARRHLPRRGALWVSVQANPAEIQVINTHLGLHRLERLAQTDSLLGHEWMSHKDCRMPLIVCGDFNAPPGSRVYRRYLATLRDVQRSIRRSRPRKTFPSHYPLIRIDHIFVSSDIRVESVEVPRTPLTRLASDHLPLIANLLVP